ncbi:MAG: DUF4416 family protein [bacterium]
MGEVRLPSPAKLFIALILSDNIEYNLVLDKLVEKFGDIDLKNEIMPFCHTTYYQKEMGEKLWRTHIAFQSCIYPQKLAEIKLLCNKLEMLLADKSAQTRRVNIDPGYLTLSKIVLATTKDHNHRIYLNNGIYAEVTLSYSKKNGWQPLPWTYPDYRWDFVITFFNKLRQIYHNQKKLSFFFGSIDSFADKDTDFIEHN